VAYNRAFNEQQYADQRADTAWNQAFQTQQYTDQRSDVAYNREFNERQYADQRADVAYNREFAEKQFNDAHDEWLSKLEYSRMSDDQKYAYNWVSYALQNGNDVSDDLLSKAGLSRDDYNRMKQQAQASTRGSYNPGSSTPAWQKAGFASEADYNDAKNLGITDPATYQDYKSKQKTPFQSLMDQLSGGPKDSNTRAMSIASMITGKENPTTNDIISAGRGPLNTEKKYTTDVIQDATDLLNARRQRTNTGTPYQTGVKKSADKWKAKG
jgi:hypothetical protein